MNSLQLFNISVYISTFSYFSTTIVNSLIILLTMFFTEKINGTYAIMIIIAAFIGIMFSTLDYIVHPFFHNLDYSFIYFTKEPFGGLPKSTKTMVLGIYATMYATVISFLTVQFIYRCGTVCINSWAENFKVWKLVLCVSYSFAIGLIYGLTAYHLAASDELTDNFFRDTMMNEYHVDIDDIPAFSVIAYNKNENPKKIRWTNLMCMVTLLTCVFVQYIIVIVCGILMQSKIQQKFQLMSRINYNLQKQFLMALILQLITPLIFIDFGAAFIFIIPYFDLKLNIPSGVLVNGFSLYPLVDSLILLAVVSEYRHIIRRRMRKFLDNRVVSEEHA